MKPRVYVSLSEDVHSLVGRLARLQNKSLSGAIASLLEEQAPILSTMIDELEKLKSKTTDDLGTIKDGVLEAEREALDAHQKAIDALQGKLDLEPSNG